MSSGRVVRPSPMVEGRAQLKLENPTTEVSVSEFLIRPEAFPIFHESLFWALRGQELQSGETAAAGAARKDV